MNKLSVQKGDCYNLLQHCICPQAGEKIYHLIANEGFESDSFLGTHCIRMFARFEKLEEANYVFSQLRRWPSVYAWSAIILANSMLGNSTKALHLYSNMNQIGTTPDSHTFVAVLRACTNERELSHGMLVHSQAIEWGLETVNHVVSGLIGLYTCYNRLNDAMLIFDRQPKPNVVLWGALIDGCVQNEYFLDAISLFGEMLSKGIEPSPVTNVCAIKACASSRSIMQGMFVHSLVIEADDELQTFLGSSLVDMYGSFGMLHDARKSFDKLQKEDVVEWNAMIAVETMHAVVHEVLKIHSQLLQHGVESNQSTLTCILNVCAESSALQVGKQIHTQILNRGLKADLSLTNALANLYAKCGDTETACKIIRASKERNSNTWTVMFEGCAKRGRVVTAFQLLEQLNKEDGIPDGAIFLSILGACSHIVDLRMMHSCIVEAGLESDGAVASNLISRYGHYSSVFELLNIFEHLQSPDVVIWNSLISALAHQGHTQIAFSLFNRMRAEKTRADHVTYGIMISLSAQEGLALEALQLFQQMQSCGLQLDGKVLSCTLNVCSERETLQAGELIHGLIIESNYELDANVVEALVQMYLLSDRWKDAEKVFDSIELRNVGLWNAMISGYAQNVHVVEKFSIKKAEITLSDEHIVRAYNLYHTMNQEGTSPDLMTFLHILRLCSKMVAVGHGNQVYAHIIEAGLEKEFSISNILVHMYAELNSIEDAVYTFRKLEKRNVSTFNALFTAFVHQNRFGSILDGFNYMQQEGVKADGITILSLLSACARTGKQDEALEYFRLARVSAAVEPMFRHYVCMVDLMGRLGFLTEGGDLLQTMPFLPNYVVYTSIKRHCMMYGSLAECQISMGRITELVH